MNDCTRKILLGLGYSAWFSVLFVALTLLTFPWSRVRDNVTVAASKADLALTMDSLGPAWVGARAKNLSVGALSTGEPTTPWITFERLKARTGLFAVLRTSRELSAVAAAGGKPANELVEAVVRALGSASVDADLYGGEMALALGPAGEEAAQFDMNLRDVDLHAFEFSNASFSMDPRGTLRGKSDVTWNWRDAKKAAGAIDLAIDDLVVSGLKAGAFGLPEMAFTRSEAHLKIARGKAEFVDTVFEADEVQAAVEGTITLQESLMRSRLAIKLRFKLRDDLDGLAKVAMGSNPRHKDEEGWYHYQVTGTLARYRIREAPAAAGANRGTAARRPAATSRPSTMDDDDDDDEAPTRVSRRTNPPGDEPVVRKKLHEMEDPAEIEAERERLREEREKRREERKARREELLAKRRERQERLATDREDGGGQQVTFDDNFVRTNRPPPEEDPEEEIIDEPEEIIDEVIEEPEEIIEEPDGEYIEEVPEGDENYGGDGGEYIEE